MNKNINKIFEEEKISVIIPVYNGAKFIDACLENIISQTYKNLEIICINDGSKDDTLEKLENWSKKDKRIIVLTQENKGLGAARNAGIRKASGKYIGFIDVDDKINFSYYEDLYKSIKKYQADIAQGSIKNIDEKKKEILCETFISRFKQQKNGCSVNKLYKADFLKKNKIYFREGLIWEDNIFTLKICAFAQKLCLVPRAVYYYTENRNSLSRSSKTLEKRKKDSLIAIREILDFIKPYQDKQISKLVRNFIINNLVLWEFLEDKEYRATINNLLGGKVFVNKFFLSIFKKLRI